MTNLEKYIDEIQVGDIYKYNNVHACVVTRFSGDDKFIYIMWADGSTGQCETSKFRETFTKTNKTYPIEDLFKQMRGESNE